MDLLLNTVIKYTQLQQLLVTCLRCSGNTSWKITVTTATKQHVHTYQTVVVSTSRAQSKTSYGLWLQLRILHSELNSSIVS